MKRINFKIPIIKGIKTLAAAFSFALATFIISCDDMNNLHEKYLNEGEKIYLGITDSIRIHPGNHRIKFEWKLSSDPRITKTVIYWNKRDTCVVVRVTKSTLGTWVEAQINNLPEADYIFEFEMQDDNGNISKPTEIAGAVLGQIFVENLRNRGVKSLAKLETKDMQITWDAVNSSTLQYSVIEYVNTEGQEITVNVPNTEEKTLLQGLQTNSTINLYAVHKPKDGLETFNSIAKVYTMPKFEREISKSKFVAALKPGDNTTPYPGGGDQDYLLPITDFSVNQRSVVKLWDGGTANNTNGKTILHTEDQSGQLGNARFKFPHQFSFDIGTLASLSRIRIWPRTDATAFTGHSPRFIEIWATDVQKGLSDFSSKDEFEKYYRTTYVNQKNPANYVSGSNANYTDKLTQANSNGKYYAANTPEAGIFNWQEDWIKLGDFELNKPSGLVYNSKNDADVSAWSSGFDFNLKDVGKKLRYIRIVVKYPNWQNSNCINLGEVTLYGDDL